MLRLCRQQAALFVRSIGGAGLESGLAVFDHTTTL